MAEKTWQCSFKVIDEEKKKRIRGLLQQYPNNLTVFDRLNRSMLVYINNIPWSIDDTAEGIGKAVKWLNDGIGEKPSFFK